MTILLGLKKKPSDRATRTRYECTASCRLVQ